MTVIMMISAMEGLNTFTSTVNAYSFADLRIRRLVTASTLERRPTFQSSFSNHIQVFRKRRVTTTTTTKAKTTSSSSALLLQQLDYCGQSNVHTKNNRFSRKKNLPCQWFFKRKGRLASYLFSGSNNNDDDNNSLSKSSSEVSNSTVLSAISSSSDGDATDTPNTVQSDKSVSEDLPSYRKLIVFTATTILIWISEPLLSLVDTTIVGMTSSAKSAVVQIAALGPATTLYDSAIYMTYFLAIAATNELAPALAKKDYQQLRSSTSHLMGLALLFGSIVSMFTFGLGKPLIANMVGGGQAISNPEIIPLATTYAWIRAAVAPFSVVDFVAQSFCLAKLDTVTPAIAVVTASIVNIVGDLLLSPRWGINGAAVATAAATVSSCLILGRKVRKTMNEWKVKQMEEQVEKSTHESIPKSTGLTMVVDGSIEIVPSTKEEEGKEKGTSAVSASMISTDSPPTVPDIPFWSFPNRKALIDLCKLAGPIFFVMMGKIACYSIMTIRATNYGIVPLASHNIMMRVFFFFSCFGDSLSQAAQTFFPQTSRKNRSKLFGRLLKLSGMVGLVISQLSYIVLKHFGNALTKDGTVIKLMADYAPYVGASILLHPFIMLLEGDILARRDLLFLVGMYLSTMTLHFGFVFSPVSSTFAGLWRAFFVFQAIRIVHFGGRVWERSRKERQELAT